MNDQDNMATQMPPDAPQQEMIDLVEIKSKLNLPATASDVDLITTLVNLVSHMQTKYEGLLADAVAMEDKMVNRELADYSDIIDQQNAPYWKEQLLVNRSVAIDALNSLRERMTANANAQQYIAEPTQIPFVNRLAEINRTIDTVANSRADAPQNEREKAAVQIRNRAHEIARNDRVPFIVAFARAESEINKESK